MKHGMKERRRYWMMVTFRQIAAAVDIHNDYIGDDSPRRDRRTTGALHRKGLCNKHATRLTVKGEKYIEAFMFEFESAPRVLQKDFMHAA